MFNFIKRRFCKHYFVLIATYEDDIIQGVGYRLDNIYVVYCAKCRTEKRLPKHEYETLIAKQNIHNNKK